MKTLVRLKKDYDTLNEAKKNLELTGLIFDLDEMLERLKNEMVEYEHDCKLDDLYGEVYDLATKYYNMGLDREEIGNVVHAAVQNIEG